MANRRNRIACGLLVAVCSLVACASDDVTTTTPNATAASTPEPAATLQPATSATMQTPAAQTWSAVPRLLVPVHGVPAAVVDNVLYLLGGSSRAGGVANQGGVYAYRP